VAGALLFCAICVIVCSSYVANRDATHRTQVARLVLDQVESRLGAIHRSDVHHKCDMNE